MELSKWVADHTPRRVVSWVIVRVFAEVSTGRHSTVVASELTLFQAQEAWNDKDGG